MRPAPRRRHWPLPPRSALPPRSQRGRPARGNRPPAGSRHTCGDRPAAGSGPACPAHSGRRWQRTCAGRGPWTTAQPCCARRCAATPPRYRPSGRGPVNGQHRTRCRAPRAAWRERTAVPWGQACACICRTFPHLRSILLIFHPFRSTSLVVYYSCPKNAITFSDSARDFSGNFSHKPAKTEFLNICLSILW